MTKFPERLKEERIKKDLTQKQIADIVNLQDSSISLYESGARQPSFATLIALADYFNLSVDYLLGRIDLYIPKCSSDDPGLINNKTKAIYEILENAKDLPEEELEQFLIIIESLSRHHDSKSTQQRKK